MVRITGFGWRARRREDCKARSIAPLGAPRSRCDSINAHRKREEKMTVPRPGRPYSRRGPQRQDEDAWLPGRDPAIGAIGASAEQHGKQNAHTHHSKQAVNA